MKLNLFVEYEGHKVLAKNIEERFKEHWKVHGGKIKDLEEVELYFKPEESACYYVITGHAEKDKKGETGKIHI